MKKFRRIIPEIVVQRQSQAENSEFFLIRTIGPTGFLLKDGDKTVKTYLGDEHSCECDNFKIDKELCQHICWILLKRFRMNKNDPLSWQSGLVKRDIDELMAKGLSSSLLEEASTQSESEKKPAERNNSHIQRKIDSIDVCPICQDSFYTPINRRCLVTYCKYGCGKSVHIKCIKVWMEHQQRKSSTSSESQKFLTCPMCRGNFSEVKLLKEEFHKERVECSTKIPTATKLASEFFLREFKACTIEHPYECSSCHEKLQGKVYQEIESKRLYCWTCFKQFLVDSKNELNFQCIEKPKDKPYKVGYIPFNSQPSSIPILCNRNDFFSARLRETVYSKMKTKTWQCLGCLMNFKPEDVAIRLSNCNHVFHSQCVRSHLLHLSATCPIDGIAVTQLPKFDTSERTPKKDEISLEVVGSSGIKFNHKKRDSHIFQTNKKDKILDASSLDMALHVTKILKP